MSKKRNFSIAYSMFNTSDVYIYSQNFFHENMRRRFFTYMVFNENVENLHLLGSEKTSDLPVREILAQIVP